MSLEVITLPLESLVLPDKNKGQNYKHARRAKDDGRITNPILVDELGATIAGDDRLLAAVKCDFTEIPCIFVSDAEPEVRRVLLRQDKILAKSGETWTPALVEKVINRVRNKGAEKCEAEMVETATSEAFVATDAQRDSVRLAAACGLTHDIIRKQLKNPMTGNVPSVKAFTDTFADDLKEGKAVANANVANSLYQKAIGDGKSSVAAAIFWLKTQAGWKDANAAEFVKPWVLNNIVLPENPIEAQKMYQKLIGSE